MPLLWVRWRHRAYILFDSTICLPRVAAGWLSADRHIDNDAATQGLILMNDAI